ncbi:APC family permease [Streptomyces sp. NPDC029554]|uniref:APC family permease n=1 Tax=Streptomyces sp. NPDC029554 TaxID=3155126 RepID=UPI0033F992D9
MTKNIVPAPPPEASERPEAGTLKSGAAGTPTIIAMVVAAAAPITCSVSVIPLAFLLGNGIGTPGAILLVTVVLALFAAGFVRIVPFIKNAGAFYAYITAGFGRPVGLASAYVIGFAYVALGASIIGGFGYFSDYLLERHLGLSVPWAVAGILGVALSTVLAMAGITVAGRTLLVILGVELAAITVLNVAILVRNGLGSLSFEVFEPSNVLHGSVGIALIYAFVLFLGFEGTAIYVEEAKAPERSVPRATYWVIGLLGGFHILSSWVMTAGAGIHKTIPRIAEAPPLFTFGLSDQYVGSGWTDTILVLNLLSLFAGIMAFHNAAARYLFSLSRDRALPGYLGRTHRRLGTPIGALATIGVVFAAVTIAYWAADLDPVLEMGTSLIGVGTIGLVAALTIASVSIATFFYRRRQITTAHVAAPALAAGLLGACSVAGILNREALTGVTTWWINNLAWLYIPIFLAGLAYALWLRRNRPETYAELGKTRA